MWAAGRAHAHVRACGRYRYFVMATHARHLFVGVEHCHWLELQGSRKVISSGPRRNRETTIGCGRCSWGA